jgi:D-alanyl-D-alanine carboxypeptidase
MDGTLDLDAKISRWLGDEPWFDRLPNGDTITLRHLLNHSSGLIDHVFNPDSGFQAYAKEVMSSGGELDFDPHDLVRFVLDRPPLFPAGEGYRYTDTGYILVGLIIEKATDSTYYEQLQKRLLQPLRLQRTVPQNTRRVPGIVQGYGYASSQLFGLPVRVVEDGAFVFDPSLEWTGGGLVSNPLDLVHWAKLLYEGEAMEGDYLERLLKSVSPSGEGKDDAGRPLGYGLGVAIMQTPYGTAYGHGGFFPGYNSQVAYFPDYGVAVAMQINTDASNLQEHFFALAGLILEAVGGQ